MDREASSPESEHALAMKFEGLGGGFDILQAQSSP